MATTSFRGNFGTLAEGEIEVWRKQLTFFAKDNDPFDSLSGGDDAVIQIIDDLTKTEGETVVSQAVPYISDGGRVGDTEREGREVELSSDSMRTTIDIISQQNRNKGKLSDQQSVINFRETSSKVLQQWIVETQAQQKFHVLSGITMDNNLSGGVRMDSNSGGNTGPSEWKDLAWASDITIPSPGRHLRIEGSGINADGDTGSITPTDTLNYSSITEACAFLDDAYIKPVMDGSGEPYYFLFLTPRAIAKLKNDPDFLNAQISGQSRGDENPIFTGAIKTVDGLAIRKHRYVYTNRDAGAGNMWGGAGDVVGSRGLLLGAQAMVQANCSDWEWIEEQFQYKSQVGISTDSIYGMRKTVFENRHSTDANGKYLKEDFGVVAFDMAI